MAARDIEDSEALYGYKPCQDYAGNRSNSDRSGYSRDRHQHTANSHFAQK